MVCSDSCSLMILRFLLLQENILWLLAVSGSITTALIERRNQKKSPFCGFRILSSPGLYFGAHMVCVYTCLFLCCLSSDWVNELLSQIIDSTSHMVSMRQYLSPIHNHLPEK